MATSDVNQVKRIPVRAVFNPTNLTIAFPYGGTELGLVKDVKAHPNQVFLPITEEPFGEEVIDLLDVGESWRVDVTFRCLDMDALVKIFPAVAVGAKSGKSGIAYTSAYRSGTLRSNSAGKILIVPYDTGRHPCVYLPNALPIVARDAEEIFQVSEETVVKGEFYATRDGSGRVFYQVRLEDLVL